MFSTLFSKKHIWGIKIRPKFLRRDFLALNNQILTASISKFVKLKWYITKKKLPKFINVLGQLNRLIKN